MEDNFLLNSLLDTSYTDFSESESSNSSLSLLSDDDHEDEKKARMLNYVEVTIKNYSDEEFKSHFRMKRSTAYKLLGFLSNSGFIPSHLDGREKISAEKALFITVWYMSNQETFRQISDRFDVSYSSAHSCGKRVVNFLMSIKSDIIKWPTPNEIVNITEFFSKKSGIDNVIGAIDGTHIEINKPVRDSEVYFNRKGYPSLLLQGIVDHKRKFIDVYCGEPGSLHDARLLRKSGIFRRTTENPHLFGNNILLGDCAYPNLNWLVTPFKDTGHLTDQERIFNQRLSSARVIVENAFALLKGRFRRLRKLDNLDLHFCAKLMMGACVLHNLCIDEEDFIEVEVDQNQPESTSFDNESIMLEDTSTKRQQSIFKKMFDLP